MREIKFRGKDKKTNEWFFGYLTNSCYGLMIVKELYHIDGAEWNVFGKEVYPEPVGQYTGLKDKNGVEVYEGDMISYSWDGPKIYGRIEYNTISARFEIKWGSGDAGELSERFMAFAVVEVADNSCME